LQAPTLAWPPGCTHRGHLHIHPGGRAVYTTHSPDGYPRGVWHRYVTDVGQLSRLDFHQLACSLVGCSFPGTASRPACQVAPSRAPRRLSLLPACPPPRAVCSDPSPTSTRRADPAQCPDPAALPWAAVRAALVPLYPRGPWLRSEFCCLGPSSLTPTPSAGLAGTRRLHGPAAYTPRLRCTGVPRRPTRPSLLSLPSCPCVPSTLRRWVRDGLPVVHPPRCQTSSCYERVATHKCPSLPAMPDGVMNFGAASFASCCGPRICPAPPGWLRRDAIMCSAPRLLRLRVTPAL